MTLWSTTLATEQIEARNCNVFHAFHAMFRFETLCIGAMLRHPGLTPEIVLVPLYVVLDRWSRGDERILSSFCGCFCFLGILGVIMNSEMVVLSSNWKPFANDSSDGITARDLSSCHRRAKIVPDTASF